ncbi:hypothetical protein [Arenimonas oryziterrae]|uniref:Uncharacterized protein n=1 Tax=Arenimonas oryziterrae DSM 21050 = YC6267 TaxID=1121015 RepID=A0A091APJ1_9GAMM|nr:hypothetical protein [Arenimonas oryziterrae]KFN41296.1 hypothetical protein N789_05310 [Arenimonas oryziterrae DSM 21050 = YC6267]
MSYTAILAASFTAGIVLAHLRFSREFAVLAEHLDRLELFPCEVRQIERRFFAPLRLAAPALFYGGLIAIVSCGTHWLFTAG